MVNEDITKINNELLLIRKFEFPDGNELTWNQDIPETGLLEIHSSRGIKAPGV